MLTIKDVEKLGAKEIQENIEYLEKIKTNFELKLTEVKAKLSPYYHVRNLRTGSSMERVKWEAELNSNITPITKKS